MGIKERPQASTGSPISSQVLGVQPPMGRLFTQEDARNGAAPVVVLSDGWGRRQFAADPAIVGKAFDMNGRQTTAVALVSGYVPARRASRIHPMVALRAN